jgi:hypothetical protein
MAEILFLLLLILMSIPFLLLAAVYVILALCMITCGCDLALRIWLWQNGITGEAHVTDIKKQRSGRGVGHYAWYEFSVGDQVYSRKNAEISYGSYKRLASGQDKIPVRYAHSDPTISYPWSQGISYGFALAGILLVAMFSLSLLFIRPRNPVDTFAEFCMLGIIAAWLVGIIYAYSQPRKAFDVLALIEQERPSKALWRRILAIVLNTSQ